jgi:NNP family nitrate/nitrite transporter-like MFS transporter
MKKLADDSRALVMGTLAFTVSFAVWGLIAGVMPILKKDLQLSATSASMLIAIPVLLGSLGRLPAGFLADKYGPKRVFTILLAIICIPAFLLGFAHTYDQYKLIAVFLGLAGTSFAIGVPFVSRWFPAERQGTVLGIYGAGNIGHSLAVFGGPAIASAFGLRWAFWIFSIITLVYAIIFATQAKDAPAKKPPQSPTEAIALFFKRPMTWLLSLLYFQTFGGFVALSIYMPLLLKETFNLSASDAGFRTAMFVILATAARPLGGFCSDKLGSSRVVTASLLGLIPCGFILTSSDLGYFTVGALGAAFCLGLGNGAVFKLVPHYFPAEVGTVTGLVGAAGGMGGFFPPLVLGYCRDHLGSYGPGFYCLSAFALICLVIFYFSMPRPKSESQVVLA